MAGWGIYYIYSYSYSYGLIMGLSEKSIWQLPLLVLPHLRPPPAGTSVGGKLLGTGAYDDDELHLLSSN